MTTSIQKMQSNDLFRSSTPAFSESVSTDIQSQLSMLYALAQQQLASSSPSDFQNKRFKKSMPLSSDLPTQVPFISATDSSPSDREVVKVVTTAGPQAVDKEFLNQLLTRKDVIPARKRRDFIPNDLKDDHYWERRRKNNLAAKRSREKRRMNDIVLETKVVELTNENETLKAKLQLMLSRLNMKDTDMENLFEEEQRLGHICLKPATSASAIFSQHDDHDEHLTMSSSETHDEDETISHHENAVDLTRSEVKTGNLLTKSPSSLTPSPSPPNESLLQILANQMHKPKQQEPGTDSRLLTVASPSMEKKDTVPTKDDAEDDDQQQNWDEAAMTLLSLNKLPPPTPVEQQQAALQSVINGLLRKPNPPKATIDYHSHAHSQQIQGENFHFDQWKTLMNYFSMPSTQQPSVPSNFSTNPIHPPSTHELRGDMMPLKLRMKMLNTRS